MADALLPCPFCGGVQIEAFHHIDRGWGASWHVECVAEECGNSTCHHDTEAAAIAAWNKRQPTQSDALREENERLREAVKKERAAIVAWLMREEDDYPSGKYSGFAAIIREEIEAGEHLK